MQPVKKQRNYILIAFLIPVIIAALFSCSPVNLLTKEHTYETDDTKFHNGEMLLPDYVHNDTLIVTDAKFINWAMEYYDAASDGDISDILRVGTVKYIQPINYSITCNNDTLTVK